MDFKTKFLKTKIIITQDTYILNIILNMFKYTVVYNFYAISCSKFANFFCMFSNLIMQTHFYINRILLFHGKSLNNKKYFNSVRQIIKRNSILIIILLYIYYI